MGLMDRLGLSRNRLDVLASPIELNIKSPWADGSLSAIMWSELLGDGMADTLPMARADAIQIPAVSKARNLLVSTVARFPLVALRREATGVDTITTTDHSWLYRTNGNVQPYERMAWTVDDMIFYGASVWLTERGAPVDGKPGPILEAEWCPPAQWKITDGHLLVNDRDVSDDEFLLINSPFEGLLNVGNRTLRGARDTEEAWTGRMRNPIPLIELRVTDDSNLDQEEIDAYVKAWAAERRKPNGGVNFTPPGIELIAHGDVQADLFAEGRNAIRTDVGSFLNVRASMLDGTTGVDSLTYTTKDGERNLFYELDLPFWTDPIEAALSGDKCVPRGQRVRFDKYAAYQAPLNTGTPTED